MTAHELHLTKFLPAATAGSAGTSSEVLPYAFIKVAERPTTDPALPVIYAAILLPEHFSLRDAAANSLVAKAAQLTNSGNTVVEVYVVAFTRFTGPIQVMNLVEKNSLMLDIESAVTQSTEIESVAHHTLNVISTPVVYIRKVDDQLIVQGDGGLTVPKYDSFGVLGEGPPDGMNIASVLKVPVSKPLDPFLSASTAPTDTPAVTIGAPARGTPIPGTALRADAPDASAHITALRAAVSVMLSPERPVKLAFLEIVRNTSDALAKELFGQFLRLDPDRIPATELLVQAQKYVLRATSTQQRALQDILPNVKPIQGLAGDEPIGFNFFTDGFNKMLEVVTTEEGPASATAMVLNNSISVAVNRGSPTVQGLISARAMLTDANYSVARKRVARMGISSVSFTLALILHHAIKESRAPTVLSRADLERIITVGVESQEGRERYIEAIAFFENTVA